MTSPTAQIPSAEVRPHPFDDDSARLRGHRVLESGHVRRAPDRDQDGVDPGDALRAGGAVDLQPAAGRVVADHPGSEPDRDALVGERGGEHLRGGRISRRQHPRREVDQRDAGAEAREGAGHLDPDRAGADDRQMGGRPLHLEDRLVGEQALGRQARDVERARTRAGGDHHVGRGQLPLPVRPGHRHAPPGAEAGTATDQVDALRCRELVVLATGEGVARGAHRGERPGGIGAVGRVAREVDQALGGDAADVGAVAPDPPALHERHRATEGGQPDRDRQAARARADHDGVVGRLRRGHRAPGRGGAGGARPRARPPAPPPRRSGWARRSAAPLRRSSPARRRRARTPRWPARCRWPCP